MPPTKEPDGAPVPPPAADPVTLPPAPEVVHVSPGAPQAEPGDTTSEYKLVRAVLGVITTATALFDVSAATSLIHIDPTVVLAGNAFSASLVGLVTTGYAFARSIRKQGTQG